MTVQEITNAFLEIRKSSWSIESEKWSEADTRSKLIDKFLISVLAWKETDIKRELSRDKKRLDYLLSTTRPVMVVEAKKAAKNFPIPTINNIQNIKISTFIKANPSIKKDLEQVSGYCWKWSAPLAILTNGKTFMAFMAVRIDGIPWEEGNILILPDIFNNKRDFADIYNHFSKDSILSGRLQTTLINEHISINPQNVLSTYSDPNSVILRNPIGLALEPLLSQVFSDVTREDSNEVLGNCYVLPGETTLRNEEFEALLLDTPPRFSDAVVNINSKNAFTKFQESIKDYLNRQSWTRTILVIGGLGVGKTMFLRRFFSFQAEDDSSRSNTCPFFIDFRKPGLDPQKIPEFIYDNLYEQILSLDEKKIPNEEGKTYDFTTLEGLKQVFWSQMQRFNRGPYGKLRNIDESEFEKARIKYLGDLEKNKSSFVAGAFRVLKERYHRNVCVILDNADQCDPKYQEAVYIFSRTLEERLKCLVIVALREEWYWYFGKKGGPLSAYHDVVYHIPAPRARDVLDRRLGYAIKLLENYHLPAAIAQLGNITLEAKHLLKYLNICKRAFFVDSELTVFFECLSNGCVRKGLEIFLEFIRSGHTHVDEYLKAFVEGESYTLQFHQIFKPISRGSYAYYCSNRSSIPNVFYPIETIRGSQLSYFSRLYLLNHLSLYTDSQSQVGLGYVPITKVYEFLSSLGLSSQSHGNLIKDLYNTELIQPNIKMIENIKEWTHIRISSFGLYTLRILVSQFSYIESIMLDTPISDTRMHSRISGLYLEGVKPALHQRSMCVKDFLKFLSREEALEQIQVQTAGISDMCPCLMENVIAQSEKCFEIIKSKIEETPFI